MYVFTLQGYSPKTEKKLRVGGREECRIHSGSGWVILHGNGGPSQQFRNSKPLDHSAKLLRMPSSFQAHQFKLLAGTKPTSLSLLSLHYLCTCSFGQQSLVLSKTANSTDGVGCCPALRFGPDSLRISPSFPAGHRQPAAP